MWIVPSERVCDVTTEQGTDGRPYFGALRECYGCYTRLMATINHIAGSGRKCGRHFHRDHLHISCGLVCVSTVARRCRRAATARGSRRTRARRKCTRVAAERALRLGRRPTWRFTVDGPEACTRNIEAATGAIASLGDVILKGPAGKDDKSAADIGLLLDYLTENQSHSMQQTCDSCLGNQPSMEINLPVKIQHHRRRRFLCAW